MIKGALSGSKTDDKNTGLRQLSYLTSDVTFSEEFIKVNGHKIIIDMLTAGNL